MNVAAIYRGNSDLESSCTWQPPAARTGVAPLPGQELPNIFDELDECIALIRAMAAEADAACPKWSGTERRDTSLARANGWGSAGQCPAKTDAKTPAVHERGRRVAAATGSPPVVTPNHARVHQAAGGVAV